MNIGFELSRMAKAMPDAIAVVEPDKRGWYRPNTKAFRYRQVSFKELDDTTDRVAKGMLRMGLRPGMRVALLVPPGIDFVVSVFALLKSGALSVLIDPGMGPDNLLHCLREVGPDGFFAIPKAHALRVLKRKLFPSATFNVTVGTRWFWGGTTLKRLESAYTSVPLPMTDAEDPAAIIFTTGSTGPPKGVLYRQRNFAHQVEQIRDRYGIQPGEIDLPGFPLFALFNCAMGVTTVFPDMDFTRPADVNPVRFLSHAEDWSPTQSFGSPALWNTVGRYCETHDRRLESVKRVLSAGAPVPPHVLRRVRAAIATDGEVHTPYGATEALPVASIAASEVLTETAMISARGGGTCVGRRFPGIEWRVIEISDEPIKSIAGTRELPRGQIGELIVKGPVVTTEYVTQTHANAFAKITDGQSFWHRMGDCGYLDKADRFWFCGRKSHRVATAQGTMFTVPCEAIANQHPNVFRSALVGIASGKFKRPVMLVETWPESTPADSSERTTLLKEVSQMLAANELTKYIQESDVLWHPGFPVDIRHNSKIFREKLEVWAKSAFSESSCGS